MTVTMNNKPITHVYLLYAEFDPSEYEIVGVYAARELAEEAREVLIAGGQHSRASMRIDSYRIEVAV